jgi:hypothetical protein
MREIWVDPLNILLNLLVVVRYYQLRALQIDHAFIT